MTAEIAESIETKIRELETEFQNSQGLILSEDDLKCNVFRKIYPLFQHSLDTMDQGIKGSQLHTEVKFFDENDALTIKPDITLLEARNLSIFHSLECEVTDDGIKYKKYSGKQFEFGGDTLVIELKFCKNKSGVNRRHFDSYKKDLEKIKRLQRIANSRDNGSNKLFGVFAVFNKTNKRPSYFDELLTYQNANLKVIYATGNVRFA